MEDIETIETRHPQDVDVVNFCYRPAAAVDDVVWNSLINSNRALFDPALAKTSFKCDPYFVDFAMPPGSVVNLARFWFGLFSHRRNGLWKGLLQVPIALSQDDIDASIAVQL